jgi:hypothetical protein
MKNLQKGFIVPVLLEIIAVLVIGGGVYIYESKKTETPPVVNNQNQLPNQNQQQTNTQTPVATQPKVSPDPTTTKPLITVVSENQNKIEENKPIENGNINKPINDTNNVNKAKSLCNGISETECFAKLSGCVKANSAKDFLDTKEFSISYNKLSGWPEEWTNKITPPIQTNFPNAEMYLNIQPLGSITFPFIKLGNTYCNLNEENAKIVFSPIKTKEDALKYYLFLKKNLGSADERIQSYIMKATDYYEASYQTSSCGSDSKEKLQNRITETKDINGGYLITFIGFNDIYKAYFFELKIQVDTEGTIKEISRKTLLDCGEGAVF